MTLTVEEAHAALTAPGQYFEMVEEDVLGVPMRTWKHAAPSLRSVLEGTAKRGDTTFLVYEDERISFEQHRRAVARFAHALVDDFGVTKGDRVAIAMRNYPEWVVAFWATASIGAVVVPLNAWWTAPELAYGLADSGSKVLVSDAQRAERLTPHLGELGLGGVVVAKPEGALPAGTVSFDDVVGDIAGLPELELPDAAIAPDDDATIFYTSGTTGKPKGALGTHRNICGNLFALLVGSQRAALRAAGSVEAAAEAKAKAPKKAGSQLVSVPFFHATGCHSVLLSNTAFGGKLVIMHKWDAERALELIEREQVTNFGGVPSMVWEVLESPSFATRDISSVTSISYGGAPAPPELVRRIEAMFPGRTPANGYGLTETSSITTQNTGVDYLAKSDSVGVPIPVCEVKVVGDDGETLPAGAVGELWIKGPNVVKGYWNKPEATAEAFLPGGWFRSGDVARIDDEGFVFIVDRAKDMVIRGGENVYCAEVEAALFEHPAVTDAAVIGVPHHVLGEEVGAVIRLKPGASATVEELRTHVGERLAAFKVPAHVWFRDDELPRNPAGKVLKRDLRDELLES